MRNTRSPLSKFDNFRRTHVRIQISVEYTLPETETASSQRKKKSQTENRFLDILYFEHGGGGGLIKF